MSSSNLSMWFEKHDILVDDVTEVKSVMNENEQRKIQSRQYEQEIAEMERQRKAQLQLQITT